MLRNTIVRIDDYDLNTSGGVQIWQNIEGQSDGITLNTNLRQRNRSHPALEGVSYNPRNQSFLVRQHDDGSLSQDDFNLLVQSLFLPDGRDRTIVVEVHPETTVGEDVVPAIEAYNVAMITSFRRNSANEWSGTFQFRDPIWNYMELSSVEGDEVIVDGDLASRPKLKIVAGVPVTRTRYTVADNTGHSIRAYPIRIVPSETLSEENYRVFVNNLEVPFRYTGGALYLRVAAGVRPKNTYVDVYSGSSINNTVYAGKMNPAGMTLNSGIATGSIEVSTDDSSGNPLAPSLAWHPSISVRHPSRRDYSYGIEDGTIKIISNDIAEDLNSLENDVDSFVMSTGSEINSISGLGVQVHAGYQRGRNDNQASGSDRQTMRIGLRVLRPGSAHHAEVTLGVGPIWRALSRVVNGDDGFMVTESTLWTAWTSVGGIGSLLSSIAASSGGAMTVSGTLPGVMYLDFNFAFPSVSPIGLSFSPRDAITKRYSKNEPADTDAWGGSPPPPPARAMGTREATTRGVVSSEVYDYGLSPVAIFEAEMVDPVTREPFDSDPDTSNLAEDPIRGRARVVVKYRRRGDPRWITAWSRTVTGVSGSGITTTYSGVSVNTPGAVEVAIGLEPVGVRQTVRDWGELEVTAAPTIHMDTSRMPDIIPATPVDALMLNGSITNTRNGRWISFHDFLCDDNGVEVNTGADNQVIRGIGGVGVVNGEIRGNGRDIPFLIEPGTNDYAVSGDLETADLIETEWRERLVF